MADIGTKTGKAAVIPLTDEGKLRIVYLLFMHQKTSINYDGFDPGTGHSTRAIQGLMDRLKKQFITDAKPGDAAATTTTTPAKTTTPKKRGRPAKATKAGTEDGESPAKKGRKKVIKNDAEDEKDEKKDSIFGSKSKSATPA